MRRYSLLREAERLAQLLLVIFSSCSTNPMEEFGPVPLATQGVYVLNEGAFGVGNSTLTLFVPDSNKVYQDVFRAVNGRNLGDTGSDIVISGTNAFIVMNGSDKIEVMSTPNNRSVRTINLRTGRGPYSVAVVGSKGYVTNIDGASVTVLDIGNFTILRDSIPVGPNPQGIVATGGKIYVCNSGFGTGRTVSVIDASDRVSRTIQVGDGPSFAKVTSDGRVWVLCTGSYKTNTPGKIFVLDPAVDIVIDSILVGGHPINMAISSDGFAYVVGDNRVMKFNTRVNQITTASFIVGFPLSSNLYCVAIDEFNGDIYVADAKDYVQNGEVRIYGSDGFPKGRFDTGIIPGAIAFKR